MALDIGTLMTEKILAKIEINQARRWLGIIMVSFVGLLCLYVVIAAPNRVPWVMFVMTLIAAGFLWFAYSMYRATTDTLILSETSLTTGSGYLLCQIDDIEKIDRGFFAMKPSNGFTLYVKQNAPLKMVTGVWWRLGKRIGIGGTTNPAQAKEMANVISVLIAKRDKISS